MRDAAIQRLSCGKCFEAGLMYPAFRIEAEQLAGRAIRSYGGKSIGHSPVDTKQPEPDLCAKASISHFVHQILI